MQSVSTEPYAPALTVVPAQHLNEVLLYFPRFLHDMLIRVGDSVRKEALPLVIGEMIIVQFFQLDTQIGYKVFFRADPEVLIALLGEHPDKFLLQRSLALIAFTALGDRFVLRDHRIFTCLGYNVEIGHVDASLQIVNECFYFVYRKSLRA